MFTKYEVARILGTCTATVLWRAKRVGVKPHYSWRSVKYSSTQIQHIKRWKPRKRHYHNPSGWHHTAAARAKIRRLAKNRWKSPTQRRRASKASKIAWARGLFRGVVHVTPESALKISRTRLRLRIGRGADNPNWRGGITKTRVKDIQSPRYREWRTAVFVRDNFTCVDCGKRGGNLQADHVKPWAFFPKLRYIIKNGATRCVLCHRKTFKRDAGYRLQFRKRYKMGCKL